MGGIGFVLAAFCSANIWVAIPDYRKSAIWLRHQYNILVVFETILLVAVKKLLTSFLVKLEQCIWW